MFRPGLSIVMIPPTTNANIIITPINLKKPDLFVNKVVTEENIIKTSVKK
jgi:hypothetical protein